ncbi:MAG TPA: S8 family serine peptidase [Gaiellaceae bacterium]|nr:S8 family serine peptidase [Gaiellaceae bacterium]
MRRAALLAALAAVVGLTLAAAGGSAVKDDDNFSNVQRFAKIDSSLLGSAADWTPASLSNQPVSVMLELGAAPVTVQDAAAKRQGGKLSEGQKGAIRAQLKAQQDALTGGIEQAGGKVVAQLQDAYNGVQVVIPQKDVPQLASLPNVTAIHAVQTYTRDNVHTVPFVGADQVWGNFQFTGKNVNVAIIDTGIDYTHADFGGPGTVAAFQSASAASTAPANPAWFGPAAPKVKGGFDLVGDAYHPGNKPTDDNTPVPDPNPLDCAANLGGGHGTHTAGTLGGFGVLSDGTTYHGPYDASTISGHTWNVGPGVAPEVNLYEYRVFGCSGATNVLADAINMAAAQTPAVSVISASIGAPLGGIEDPSSVAAQNAVNDGIAVVFSAGNQGSSAYIVGSPSTASGALSVAALDATATFPAALFSNPAITAIDANGAALPSGSLNILVLKNTDGTIADGCLASEYPTGTDLSHTIVVVRRGGPNIGTTGPCARVHKAYVGQDAGAAAVAMVNNTAGLPPFEGKITSDPNDPTKTTAVTIPFLGIAGSTANPPAAGTDGAKIYAANGQTTTLTATTTPNPGFKVAASFTSGGPRNPDSAPKPDVIAPGVGVASAGVGTGNQPATMSGTSMACPATAGIAALIKQAHPGWNGIQIKAAIIGTADPALNTGYNSRLAGAGEVQAQKAVNASTIATTPDGLDALAFGFLPGTADTSIPKSITLTNTSATSVTYNLAPAFNGASRGVTLSMPSSVTLGGNSSQTVTVTASITAANLAALPSDDTFAVGPGAVVTVRGTVVATPATGSGTDQQRLEIPFMFVPRGLSNVVAGPASKFTPVVGPSQGTGPSDSFSTDVPLTNSGIHTGTADVYTWGIHDAQDQGAHEWDVRDAGLQVLPGAALGGAGSDRSLVFLVNTYGSNANQTTVEYDLPVDTNGDGTPDFIVVGVDDGAVFAAGSFDGIMDSVVINAKTGAIVDAFRADVPMNGSIIELPLLASDLGLSDGAGTITYAVDSFSELSSGVDTTGAATLDVFHPALSSGDFASLAPNGGSDSFTFTEQNDAVKKTHALGWLIASVDDASGAAQVDEIAAK